MFITKKKKRKQQDKRAVITLKASGKEYLDSLNNASRQLRMPTSRMIDAALALYLKKHGIAPLPNRDAGRYGESRYQK